MQYYWTLRSVLKEKPHLRKCLAKCRSCQILFFTHPRNAGRSDLGCPFGCRQANRKKSAIRRSIEYYRSKEGKEKKKHLNARRSQQNNLPESSRCADSIGDFRSEIDETTLFHIQIAISLIEGRCVELNEIFCMVDKILRQLSIDKRKQIVYVGNYHHGRSP